MISFPVQMTSWPEPDISRLQYTDAVTGATPLAIIKEGLSSAVPMSQLLEKVPGYMELLLVTLEAALERSLPWPSLPGGIYMLVKKL
jgi:Na+-translocating ferredoxin:NAD+ oxidoreductase subunit D